MITLETALAAIVTFVFGFAAGLSVISWGIRWWIHHVLHCQNCKTFYGKKMEDHTNLEDVFCPFHRKP